MSGSAATDNNSDSRVGNWPMLVRRHDYRSRLYQSSGRRSERWRDKASQAAHLAGDHMGEFNQFMKHMPMSAGHIASYQVEGNGEWLLRVGISDISQLAA